MSLEDDLRAACDKAIGVTLWRTATGWQANITRDRQSWTVSIAGDPVKALRDALNPQRRMTAAIDPPAAPAVPKPRSVFD